MSIQFKNVNHVYGLGTPYENKALDGIDLKIKTGDFIGCIGHTGSGKSTLIQMINGLLKPTSGQILIGDIDITKKGIKLANIRKKVGLVFQYPEYQLFEETVFKDISYGPQNLGLKLNEIDERVRYALSAVHLDYDKMANKSPFELSGGQKRRIAIAGVLAMMPEVLILDEPTAGLDPAGRKEILDLIKSEHHRRKRTTILVSHSMEDVAKYVDKILVLDKGKNVYFDTPKGVFSHKDNLASMGLDIPEISKIIEALQNKGMAIDSNIFEVEDFVAVIAKRLGEGSC